MVTFILFAIEGQHRKTLLQSISATIASAIVVDGNDCQSVLTHCVKDSCFALLPWSSGAGFTVPDETLQILRRSKVSLIAVVPDEDEEAACLQLDTAILDIITYSRPSRLHHLVEMQIDRTLNAAVTNEVVVPSHTTSAIRAGTTDKALILFDEEKTVLQWNARAEALSGAVSSGWKSKHGEIRIPEEITDLLAEALTSTVDADDAWSGCLTLKRRDREALSLFTHLYVLSPGNKGKREYLLVCDNAGINEKKAGDRPEMMNLASLSQRFKGITYQRKDTEPRSIILHGSVQELTGYSIDDFTAGVVNWIDLIHPDDKPGMEQVFRDIAEGVLSYFDEIYTIRDRTGTLHQIRDIAGRWGIEHPLDTTIIGIVIKTGEKKSSQDDSFLLEVLYREFFDLGSAARLFIDKDSGQILDINDAACIMYGYDRKDFSKLRLVDISAEPEVTRAARLTGQKHLPLVWNRKKDGTVFPVELFAAHFVWNNRGIHLLTIRDKSDVVLREGTLQDIDSRYRLFLDYSPHGIIAFDATTLKPREFNRRAHEDLGYNRDEFVLLDLPSMFQSIDIPFIDILSRVRNTGNVTFSGLLRRKNGMATQAKIHLVRLDLIEGTVLFAIIRDISERRLTENNLRTLSRAVEQSPVMISITDADDTIQYVNPRFSAVTGYTTAEAIGNTTMILRSALTTDEAYAERWKILSSGKTWRGELCNRKKNGELYWASVSVSPVRDDNGQVLFYVRVENDITADKHLRQELVSAKERAERSDRLKDSFIANMSHEIRTPLNVILGFTGILKTILEESSNEDVDMCLDSIERGGARLLRTVDEILNISSIEAGTFKQSPSLLPVDHTVFKAVQDFSVEADERQLTLEFRPGCKGVSVFADPYVFAQALGNLLDNSLKFTKEGGVVVSTFAEKEHVIINVEDSGVGIASDYLPHLFESFSQEQGGNSRPYEGLGLGMVLTRRYVQMSNGTIEVSSRKGAGTKVSLRFPASRPT